MKLTEKITTFLKNEDGPTTVEYAVLLAMMVLMMVASIIYVGDEAQAWSEKVVDGLDDALN